MQKLRLRRYARRVLRYQLGHSLLVPVLALIWSAKQAFSAESDLQALPSAFQRWEFTVDGVQREALVYVPQSAKEKPTPVIFVFHGHGGTARNIARRFAMDRHWPESISVYMQGLNTPGRLTDPAGNAPGWQKFVGDQQDRDLKFFDMVLDRLSQDYKVDKRRIFSTGHSNGGAFTYLLWAERGDIFAAIAPSAGMSVDSLPKLKPKPVMHIAGEKDALVKFEWQEKTIAAVRKLDGCETDGKPWAEHCTYYASKTGTPVIAFVHPRGHEVPAGAPALIVKFFKEVSKD